MATTKAAAVQKSPGNLVSAWLRYRLWVVITGSVAGAAYATTSDYGSLLLAFCLIYALAVSGWNIVSGFAGQPSLGHAAFFGLGAYGAAVWSVQLGGSPWIGIALGATASALLATLVGWVSWRLKIHGIYFALILFAMSELLLVIVSNIDFLGGTTGLYGFVRKDSLYLLSFRDPLWFAGIAGAFLALTLAGTALLMRSRLGQMLSVVRHDEVAAEASGINTMAVKVVALGLSAVVTAVAGGIYAQLQLFIQPETVFGMGTNLRIILMGFLGGVGALWGPLVGSVLVTSIETFAQELFRGLPGIDGIAFGLMLVVAVLYLPRGLVWRNNDDVAKPDEPKIDPTVTGAVFMATSSARSTAQGGTRADATVLRASGLTKSFGGLTVVEDVTIQLEAGKIHGLIGPNGAGKTTLINMLTGTIQSDAGKVQLDGVPLGKLPPFGFARAGIARTFQIPRPLGDLSVWDSVHVAALASGRTSDPETEAQSALDATGLAGQQLRRWDSLNGSEKRRAEVARALAQNPRILLLDEPMSGLGAEEIDALAETVRNLSRSHPDMTVLFVEHLMRVMMNLADHITVLDRGRVIAAGTPSDVANNKSVKEAYLGSSVK